MHTEKSTARRTTYPKDWRTLSYNIRFVIAGGKCQHCGEKPPRRLLDCAHLNHDKANCSHTNLKSLCRSCHARYDSPHRWHVTLSNRSQKAGQLPIW